MSRKISGWGNYKTLFLSGFDFWKKKLGVSPLLDHPSIQCWGWLRRCFCCCLCSGFFRRKFCTQQRWWVTRWHLSGGNHGRLLKKHFPISFVYPIRNHWRFAALLSSTSTFPIVLSCTLWNNFKSLALKTLLLITSKLQRSPLTKDYFQKANGFFFKVDMIGRVCLETIAFELYYITPDIPIGHISTLVDSSVLRSALPCVRPSASAYRKETGFGTSYSPIEELRKSISGWQTDDLTKGRKLSFPLQFQALFMLFPFLKSLVSKAFRLRVMSHDYFPLYSGKY